MKKTLHLIAVTLLFVGCRYNQNDSVLTVLDDDFLKVDTLMLLGEYDIGIYSLSHIATTVDYIVVQSNDSGQDIVNILDKDLTFVRSFGKKGRASNEFMLPKVCAVIDNTIHISDIAKREISCCDLEGEIIDKISLDKTICQQYLPCNDNSYIADCKSVDDVSIARIDSSGILTINDLARYSKKYSDPSVYWGFLGHSYSHNITIYAPQFLKEIVIMREDGSTKRVIKREPQSQPIIDSNDELDKFNSFNYYWGVQTLDESFIVCCLNKRGRDFDDTKDIFIEFEEYDYEGNPLRRVVIDQFVSKFCFDGDTLYAYTNNSEKPFAIYVKR